MNNQKHGRWIEWDFSGNEIINGEYKNGQKWQGRFGENNYISGMQREEYSEKYPNGLLKSAGVLVNDVKIGSWSYWYDNGILEESGYYDNSIKYDEWNGNYISGNKKYTGSFINGKED